MNRSLFFCFLLFFTISNFSFAQCDAKAGNDVTICKGGSTVIGGSSTGNGTITYTWTPASSLDNASSATPTASPTTTTTYTLHITDGMGCSSTDHVKVTVNNLPDASFSFSPDNVCAYQTISFNANASGSNFKYSWDFGNPASPNNTASSKNPKHKFVSYAPSNSTYTVSLTVTNITTGCSSTTTQTVSIKSLPHAGLMDPISSFKNCDGTNFTLNTYDITEYNGLNYKVIWGDGNSQDLGSSAPTGGLTHVYNTIGIFDLYYIVTAPNGCLDTAKYIVSNITNPAIGAANPGNTTGCTPLNLCFPLTNYTGNHNSTVYYVDYGDNSKIDTITHDNLPNQICHSYTETSCGKPMNAYTFTIKAINQCDVSIATITPIRIYNPPTPDFSNPAVACVNTSVPFTNNTIEGHNTTCATTTLYKWDFGDGSVVVNSATKTNPTHVYTAPGTYTITLTAQNSCGATPISKTICIEDAPVVNYLMTPDTACVPFLSVVSNQSNTANSCQLDTNWQLLNYTSMCSASQNWNFTGGTNASSWEPKIDILTAGKYVFRLTLTNSCGTFYKDKEIVGIGKPKASIPAVGPLCAGESQNYTASVTDCGDQISSYTWSFTSGSPASSTDASPLNINYAAAGNYPITLSIKNKCGTANATQSILVNAPPVADAGADVSICSGKVATIGSTAVSGVSYDWTPSTNLSSTSQSTTTANPTNSGTTPLVVEYTLKAYTSPTCFTTDKVNVTVNPIPDISVSGSDICSGQTTTLTASSTDASAVISWAASPSLSCTSCASPTANPTAQTTYNATVTNQYTCVNSKPITINVNPSPSVNAGNDFTTCDQPIPFTVSATPAGGTWSGSANITPSGVFTPNGNEVSTLTYAYTDPATHCSNSDAVVITVQAPVVPTFSATPAVCENAGTVNLNTIFNPSPTGGTWSGTNVSGVNFDPQTAGSGTKTVRYSYGSGTCLVETDLTITVNPKPTITVSDKTICFGDSTTLTASGAGAGGTYSWTPATGLACATCGQTKASPPSTTSYQVKGTNQYTCSSTKTVTVTVNPLPSVNAGNDFTACDQPIPFTVSATPAGGTWSGSANITPSGVFTPNGSEVSTLIYAYTDPATHCSNSDAVVITVQAPVVPTFSATPAVCENAGTVNLNTIFNPGPTGGTWSGTNVSGVNFDPQAAGSGTKTVRYSYGSGTCLVETDLTITVNPKPTITVSDKTICFGDSTTLTASGAGASGTYSWTPATGLACATCGQTKASPPSTTSYQVKGTNQYACSSTKTVTVTVNPLPSVNAGNDFTACDQPIPFTISATPAGGTWSGSANITPSGVFTPNGNEVSTLTYAYTDPATHCSNSDAVVITVQAPVVPTFSATPAVCENAGTVNLNTVFNPNPAGGTWSGTNVSGVNFDPQAAGSGIKTVRYSYGSGTCLVETDLTITVNPKPTITVSDKTICFGDSTTLTASGAGASGTYSWTPATGLACATCGQTKASPPSTTSYQVKGTNQYACSSTATAQVTVNLLPIISVGNDTTLCNQPLPVSFNGFPSGGVWSGVGINASGVFTPATTGNFMITYTFTNGGTSCQNSDSLKITVVDPVNANAGIDKEICIQNSTVQLTGLPSGGIWSGSPFITNTGVFSVATDGTYDLIYSYGTGNCLTKDTMKFVVHPLPVVNAGVDVNYCVSDGKVNFTGTPLNGTWSGVGITNTNTGEFSPSTAGVGAHQIVYTYQNPTTTCINKDTLVAQINPLPVVKFTVDPIVCVGANTQFTNQSTLISQSHWDFGDNTTSTAQNPTHQYTTAGTYTIKLVVTSASGCKDSISKQIDVYTPPSLSFSLTPDSLCGPLTAVFTNTSSGQGVTYLWNFGNGTTSTVYSPNPVTYSASLYADTTYYISLTASNLCGSLTQQDSVKVMPKPKAMFGTDYAAFCSPWKPNIANTSYGLPDTYSWDFGNGTTSNTNSSLFQLPVYTTGIADTNYTITLAVSNECGVDTAHYTITVMPNTVDAFFNTNITSGCAPLTVNFTQYTLGGTNYHWDFGDGNVSTQYSPSHTFTQGGTFHVSLFANNGCSYDTVTATITVLPQPVLNFSFLPDSACVLKVYQFTNTTGVPLGNIHWDFGDGTTSTLTNPTHAFTAGGNFTVTLTGTSNNGCSGSVAKVVHVNAPPVANFTATPIDGCMPLKVKFTNQSTGYAYSYWDFDDGNTSVTTNPTHVYTAAGTYLAKLIVQSINGCADTITQYINVNPVPVANFTYQPTGTICGPNVNFQFTNTSTGAVGYQWNFGDGNTSTLTNPINNYATANVFTIQLIASNQFGCKDTMIQQVQVHQTPVANFSLVSPKGCQNKAVHYISSSLYADSVVWDFGDGKYGYGNSVYHAYPDTGVYVVSIVAYGSGGCTSSFTSPTSIQILSSPTADFTYESDNKVVQNATIVFTNESLNYSTSHWIFGDGATSEEKDPTHDYHHHNDYYATLIVTHTNGCKDTVTTLIHNDLLQGLYVPNAVYPEHESYEVSHFLPKGIGLKEYLVQIYDDWGNLIWESTALDEFGRPAEGWDGTYRGVPVQQDAYVWKISARFLDGSVWEGKEYSKRRFKRSGTVTVIH